MFNIFQEIANQSDMFGHLKASKYVCEDCPEVFQRPATHEFKYTAGEPDEAGTTYLCDDCTDNNNALGMLDGYDDLGNPNK